MVSYKNESFGVFTPASAVDAVVSRKDAQRFQFRTTSAFEFGRKAMTQDERGESYKDVLNAGKNKCNKYVDCQITQSLVELPGRNATGYANAYRGDRPIDFEANAWMREAAAPSRMGNCIILSKTGRPPTVDWTPFKETKYNSVFKKLNSDDTKFSRPVQPQRALDDSFRVLGGHSKSLETVSHGQDTFNRFAVTLPEGMLPSYPKCSPEDLIEQPNFHFGRQNISSYRRDSAFATKRLDAEQQRMGLRRSSSMSSVKMSR